MDLAWWIAFIGVPLTGAIFAVDGIVHRAAAAAARALHDRIDGVAKELYDFKVVAATTYATISYTKDIEVRLLAQLARIEGKLDRVLDQRV
jgi:hypothetical protein